MKHIIVLCNLSLKDPIVWGLMLDYIKDIQDETDKYTIHLFTEEQSQYLNSMSEQEELTTGLIKDRIYWHPSPYRHGRFLVLWKIWLGLVRFFQLLIIKVKLRPRLIVGFLAIAGAYGCIYSRLFRIPLAVIGFEPHSDYQLDFKEWKSASIKYKLLHYFEMMQVKTASYLTAPTWHTVDLIKEIGTQAVVYRVPVTVDFKKLGFSEEGRHAKRAMYKLNGKKVILYIGKFNGLYYSEEKVANLYKNIINFDSRFFAWIITPNPIDKVEAAFVNAKIQSDRYYIGGPIQYDELGDYISAADFGLIAVPPLPSQKYRSPVKTANYLACGVPVITNYGVSDEDVWLENRGLGVALHDFKIQDDDVSRINKILECDRSSFRRRCVSIAKDERDKEKSIGVLKEIFSAV